MYVSIYIFLEITIDIFADYSLVHLSAIRFCLGGGGVNYVIYVLYYSPVGIISQIECSLHFIYINYSTTIMKDF